MDDHPICYRDISIQNISEIDKNSSVSNPLLQGSNTNGYHSGSAGNFKLAPKAYSQTAWWFCVRLKEKMNKIKKIK